MTLMLMLEKVLGVLHPINWTSVYYEDGYFPRFLCLNFRGLFGLFWPSFVLRVD